VDIFFLQKNSFTSTSYWKDMALIFAQPEI